jgi:hypothetical protein
MLDRKFVEQVAAALGTEPGLVEKEWHVVRALSVISAMDHGDVLPVFSGGTSLSVGWGLIKRFSEDIDFKIGMPPAATPSQARTQRRQYREKVLAALTDAGLRLIEEPLSRDLSTFFSARLAYSNLFDPVVGLRPYVQVEMTFNGPTLPAVERPIPRRACTESAARDCGVSLRRSRRDSGRQAERTRVASLHTRPPLTQG